MAAAHEPIPSCLARLTPRERQVMDYILLGAPNKVIARELDVSLRTIEHHRAQVFSKMRVDNAVELLRRMHDHAGFQGWRASLGRGPAMRAP